MFELSIAKKYLTPRLRQLSVSIISLISILVIALVVWLIVVFFSVTNGLEKGWIQKLTTLTAPLRVTPTEAYYQSHYYLVDSISAKSDYTLKSLGEKLKTTETDPYDDLVDEEPPKSFTPPHLNPDGSLKDLVKEAYASIEQLNKITPLSMEDYEATMAHIRIKLIRKENGLTTQSLISQAIYLGSFDAQNQSLEKTILSLTDADRAALKHHPETEGIYLPKTFKDAGVLVGDTANISYYTPSMSAVHEQQIPVFIAGFYDPGLIPLGGKFILAPKELVSLVRSSQSQDEAPNSNGINVRFDDLAEADFIKDKIKQAFNEAGLTPYFKVETYKEYDFTKDILEQLQSDKTLFSLISAIIIIVACSNIISMLIIMVNDKKIEIGILRSMGASSFSIALIFGFCGIVMGAMGSAIGTVAAYFTLKNIKILINILSDLQGHNAFNPMFYGDTLPNEISFEAMFFVIVSTALISTIAGIVPAVKASMLRPSAILRAE